MNVKKPEEQEFEPEMSNFSLNSQKMIFTECDENELVLVNAEVEEIHRQKLLRESPPYDCPPVSLNDCCSFASSAAVSFQSDKLY